MTRRNRWVAILTGIALALAMTATVFGYSLTVPGSVTVSGPDGLLVCDTDYTFTATVLDAGASAIAGQTVTWNIVSPTAATNTVNPTTSITNTSGEATTTVRFSCDDGNRTVSATAGTITGGAVLGITSAGLPRTSTPGGSPLDSLPIATLLALLAVLAGGGIMLRRFAFSPR